MEFAKKIHQSGQWRQYGDHENAADDIDDNDDIDGDYIDDIDDNHDDYNDDEDEESIGDTRRQLSQGYNYPWGSRMQSMLLAPMMIMMRIGMIIDNGSGWSWSWWGWR